MKKFKFAALIIAVVMLVQIFSSAVLAAEVVNTTIEAVEANALGYVTTELSIDEQLPEGNLLPFSRFNNNTALNFWTASGVALSYDSDSNGGYLRVSNIGASHYGPKYTANETIPAGKYLFEGYFRTLREGYITELRLSFYQKDGTHPMAWVYPTDEWLKVSFYVELTDEFDYIQITGGPNPIMTQEYCMDNFSLVPVDEIPENAPDTFGKKITYQDVEKIVNSTAGETWVWDEATEAAYEIEGIILNHDTSGVLGAASSNGITEAELVEFARQFKGTHITDYFISVNDIVSMFPCEGHTSYLDKYHQVYENGLRVNYKANSPAGAHYLYEVLGVDFIGVFAEEFWKLGINPWLSFRMNDVHGMTEHAVSEVFSDFYHENPQIRRVQHHDYVSYFDRAMDYTYEEVREYMLDFINQALNRYDVYGIELDFLREIWLWHIGGEYNGLDTMNDFIRDVNELFTVYEEKYGHEIKLAVNVAYDVETNYSFGLDVITWITEGLVDVVSPGLRFSSTDTDLPIRMWDAITEAHGVTLAARIDPTRLMTHSGGKNVKMDIESLSACAVNYFSQGADKLYLFNYYKSSNDFFTPEEKLNSKDPAKATMWTVLGTVGSYEKSMLMNRKHILSYRDVTPLWEKTVEYLPKTVTKDTFQTFRVAVGDVAEGSKLTLKFSVSTNMAIQNPPEVYVNSKPCEFAGVDLCTEGYTDNLLVCYDIPVSEYNDTYMVVEIMSSTNSNFTTDYMEVYVTAPAME